MGALQHRGLTFRTGVAKTPSRVLHTRNTASDASNTPSNAVNTPWQDSKWLPHEVLAPLGRGTHGMNWQGPGHWSALAALDALSRLAPAWGAGADAERVLFTGHSNGGYGAWVLAVRRGGRAEFTRAGSR